MGANVPGSCGVCKLTRYAFVYAREWNASTAGRSKVCEIYCGVSPEDVSQPDNYILGIFSNDGSTSIGESDAKRHAKISV